MTKGWKIEIGSCPVGVLRKLYHDHGKAFDAERLHYNEPLSFSKKIKCGRCQLNISVTIAPPAAQFILRESCIERAMHVYEQIRLWLSLYGQDIKVNFLPLKT